MKYIVIILSFVWQVFILNSKLCDMLGAIISWKSDAFSTGRVGVHHGLGNQSIRLVDKSNKNPNGISVWTLPSIILCFSTSTQASGMSYIVQPQRRTIRYRSGCLCNGPVLLMQHHFVDSDGKRQNYKISSLQGKIPEDIQRCVCDRRMGWEWHSRK